MSTVYMQSPQGFVFHTDSPQYHNECTRLTVKDGKAAERAQSLTFLHECLKPGATVYTVLRHVSKSGMMRRIDLYAIIDNAPVYLSGHAAHVMGYPDPKDGIAVTGCGMDMGFHMVYNLGRYLWPEGFGDVGTLPLDRKIRPKTPQMAQDAISKGATFRGRNGDTTGWDNDGGYALKHQWL